MGRQAFLAGARAMLPLAIGIFPFGFVYGAAVADASISNWVGGVASSLMIAGAAQLALVDLVDKGAPWMIAVGTALVINARFVMYSAALAPSFSEHPRRWRFALAVMMTDQVAVTSLLYNDAESDPVRRRYYYLGAGSLLTGLWIISTWTGIVLGTGVSSSLQLGFAIPLMFLALLVPSIKDRSSLVAALVGAAVTVVAKDAPYNTGLLIGAVCGIASGMAVSTRVDTSEPSEAADQ